MANQKSQSLWLIIVFECMSIVCIGQEKWIKYKSDHWEDYKNKGLVKAHQHPTNEGVEITLTNTSIKAVLGKKVLNYKIISTKKISDYQLDFNVSQNGIKSNIFFTNTGYESKKVNYLIENRGNWGVLNITDISTNGVEEILDFSNFLEKTKSIKQQNIINQPNPILPPAHTYSFAYLTIDEYQQTVPDNGGSALYNIDNTGQYSQGEIEVNVEKKFFVVKDNSGTMKAIIDSGPKYDKFWDSYTYKAHWADSKERTEICIAYNNSIRIITIPVGFNKGQYADYWERIYKYHVELKH